ncbi:MAG: undecaprenyl-diphosphate phosphatase [Saprospiraceae bacterium]|nr:undecaprenyl-diphosphate phosphatase [Saprospiraceae bacterium]
MGETLQAIILGIIQGLTEFLPISSDGHLMLGKALLGLKDEENPLIFEAVIHAATTLSIIVVFWRDIVEIVRDLFKFQWNENTRFALLVLVSMIPAGIAGTLLKDQINQLHVYNTPNLILTGFMLALTGVLLWLSSRLHTDNRPLNGWKAFTIGFFQAAAMLPGLSRSGSTVSSSLVLGVDRTQATRFSFLMVVPVIIGGTAIQLKDYFEQAPSAQNGMSSSAMIAGFVVAFIVGLFSCRWMIALIRNSKLDYFAIYCLIVGAVTIAVGLMQ